MRLLLIHTGGTLMMRGGAPAPLAPDVYTRDLLTELPVLRKIASIETRILFNLDSSDIQPHHWVELASVVHEALPLYDGVVVVHGTDTMAYTASALAFLLPGLDRAVVLTGSQTPLVNVRTDARTNLVDACHLATLRIPEVGIAFNARLLRGCRATKLDAWGMAAFGSPSCLPLAELGIGVQLASHILKPRPVEAFDARIEPRVLAIRTFPGFDPKFIEGALAAGVRGILIEAFGSGNVPHLENSIIPVIEKAHGLDIPVVIASQSPRGTVDLERYEGSSAAARAGAISAGDMTTEASLAKLMVTLGRAATAGESSPHEAPLPEHRVRAVRDAFGTARVGERS